MEAILPRKNSNLEGRIVWPWERRGVVRWGCNRSADRLRCSSNEATFLAHCGATGLLSQHLPVDFGGFGGGHALLLEDAGEEAGVEVVLLHGGEGGPLLGDAVPGAAEAVVSGEGLYQGGGAGVAELFGAELKGVG